MIARLIAWSARNLLLVFFGAGFAAAAGIYALAHLPLDAIPDLSDTQVIVYTEYPGQAPQVIEDQVTYPLTTALLAVPRSKVVRGFSFFGVSFVYVVFEDGTDLYWARSRVLEYLNFAAKRLPEGITPSLGPDATGVGWVYQYVVLGAQRTLAELRTIQDWYLRYQLTKAEGVAEVASVGGFVQQYQVVVDPQKLQAYGLTLAQLTSAIRASNRDVGGRVVEMSETEYVVRGRGYLRNTKDLEEIALKMQGGTPVLLRDVARIELGPEERRGIAELNGQGITVLGISPDQPAKLAKFRDRDGLTFPLLSDPDRAVLQAYGAYGEKKLYGKTTVGVIRSTFVIDADGKIEKALYGVRAAGHVARLMTEVGA